MPDDLPRIRYKKAVLPLPADQPFQQAVAAGHIAKAAVQRVRAFLGSPHISLAVAIENAGIHDIQLTVIGKPPGIAGVRLPPGALLAQTLPMAVRLTLGYVEMPICFGFALCCTVPLMSRDTQSSTLGMTSLRAAFT